MKPRGRLHPTILGTGVVGVLLSAVPVLLLLASLLAAPHAWMPPRMPLQQAL